ncbi:hypothetical protein CCACVL1_11621 [Corchorus capsularis]|uniref:Uncharacterized protein n=1 Tax=Corchorus capsularis TaxID=210143 RepID=A0A1R3IKD3_COCAP|nr:hypothetical protein CCACVL1_11621 [Corchorus capsularis]
MAEDVDAIVEIKAGEFDERWSVLFIISGFWKRFHGADRFLLVGYWVCLLLHVSKVLESEIHGLIWDSQIQFFKFHSGLCNSCWQLPHDHYLRSEMMVTAASVKVIPQPPLLQTEMIRGRGERFGG